MMSDHETKLSQEIEKSGDSGMGTEGKASGNQNGGHQDDGNVQMTTKHGNIGKANTQGESGTSQKDCAGCHKDVQPGQNGKPSHFECNFCLKWYCLPCAAITKKPEIAFAERSDIFWSCKSCLNVIKQLGENLKLTAHAAGSDEVKLPSQKATGEGVILQKLEELKSTLEAKIETMETSVRTAFSDGSAPNVTKIAETVTESVKTAFDEHAPPAHSKVVEAVESSICHNMAKVWSSTLFGSDEFPSVNSEEWNTVAYGKKKQTLPEVIERTVTQSVNDINMNEKRKNNIIIYKAPEPEQEEASDRLASDKELVSDLLRHLGVHGKPVNVYRLGKYEDSKKGQGSRPIRVEMENPEIRAEIMARTPNLASAPDRLSCLSLSYDLSVEQRQEIKDMIATAKSQTKNANDYVFKVRGPPGKMTVRHFKKRTQ